MARVTGDNEDLPRGWAVDKDNWAFRPVRAGDKPKDAFANSCHAFIERGRLYCRSAKQARELDKGGMV